MAETFSMTVLQTVFFQLNSHNFDLIWNGFERDDKCSLPRKMPLDILEAFVDTNL